MTGLEGVNGFTVNRREDRGVVDNDDEPTNNVL